MKTDRPLMKCGHVALATDGQGKPVCPICVGINTGATEVDENPPDLTGRMACCDSCGYKKPSAFGLPFFEFRGEGSPIGQRCKNCGCDEDAHGDPDKSECVCDHYEPRGAYPHDSYYCGCLGWD